MLKPSYKLLLTLDSKRERAVALAITYPIHTELFTKSKRNNTYYDYCSISSRPASQFYQLLRNNSTLKSDQTGHTTLIAMVGPTMDAKANFNINTSRFKTLKIMKNGGFRFFLFFWPKTFPRSWTSIAF